ncbi:MULTISPECIES: HXXEE domain-containing protein [unclassified Fusibacter]|uniref:HXXEE domain-containing protein n=1 Tax=unclassified Fusibacter TaxID=2624464 RepID=UPI0013E915AD|nr:MULTISPECIES: HXXEE domain-containing protein [unclassified Fusibacter]MCK8060247.1 HXXEE domain-containing protein [Fusibacter sp. A2]NPE20466.1 HXXEE domain-containing protein [Fusibacter sp. A1]
MGKSYIEWLKDNWQKTAIVVLLYVLATLLPLYSKLELIEFMLLLAFPMYLIHEIEEYILPGGFTAFFNENLLGVKSNDKVLPIDREVVFWINMIYIWLVIPVFSGLGFLNLGFAAWIPYFLIFQALSHLAMGIKGKMIINPGIRSSFLLHTPYAIVMINLLGKSGTITNPYLNIYMVIGFMFNLLLPIFAKFIILPRYHKRMANK